MKKRVLKLLALITLTITLTAVFAACKKNDFEYKEYTMEERTAARAVQLGKTTLNTYIDSELYAGGEVYMYDTCNPKTNEVDGEASVWHYTSVVAMTNRLVNITQGEDKTYFSGYNAKLWTEMDWYKGTAELTTYRSVKQSRTMYAVKRANKKNDAGIKGIRAVYDDQMWIIRELLSAYDNTGDANYLAQAEALTDVCLDGWDDTPISDATDAEYGGITWGPGYASKHTCSNAPLIAPLVDLHLLYKGKSDVVYNEKKADYYLRWAQKIYDYCYATFKNANDLYGDLVGSNFLGGGDTEKYTISQGSLDITEYAYNTGTMISGGAKLYAATGDVSYLTQAQNSADAAYRIFGKKDEATGLCAYPTTSTLWFNFELLLGYVDLAYADDSQYKAVNKTYINSFRETLDYAYDNYYLNGFLPRSYVKGWTFGVDYDERKDVMDSAAGAEMYALIAQYYASSAYTA